MMTNEQIASVIFAAFGALLIKALDLVEIRNIDPSRRPNFRDFWYWIPFVILPLAGAFMDYVYLASGQTLNPLLSVNIGVSAPLILKSLASVAPISTEQLDPGA